MRTRSLCLFVLLSAAGACGSSVDDRPLSFEYIHPAIVLPNCARAACHSSLTHTYMIDLEDYKKASQTMEQSLVIDLLRGTYINTDASGHNFIEFRMPPDQPLPEADIELIERWQAAGSPN